MSTDIRDRLKGLRSDLLARGEKESAAIVEDAIYGFDRLLKRLRERTNK